MAEEDAPGRSQRRTRSQAAPEWTAVEELVLVNEIAAVEADCRRELSSYQKWKIVSENCAAQDVSRTLSQFPRKWDSLLRDYRRVADFESRPRSPSFWSLDARRRDRLALPRAFDRDLFAAIRSLLGARENHPESDPEDDAGAKVVHDLDAAQKFYDLFSAYKNDWEDETQPPEEPSHSQFVRQSPSKNTVLALRERRDRRIRSSGKPSGSGPGSAERPTSGSSQASQYSEVTKYLNTMWIAIEEQDFDVLKWWKGQQTSFPVLSKMACNILSVPVSSVSSESAFSSAGRIIEERRTSLKPEMVEALVCTKDWDQAERRMQDQNLEYAELVDYFTTFGVDDHASTS